MNKFQIQITIVGAFFAFPIFAANLPTNEWGGASCGVLMSIKLNDTQEQLRTNQSVNVSVRIQNTSTNVALMFCPGLKVPISFDVTSPSGKEISTGFPGDQIGSSRILRIQSKETREFNYNLSSMLTLNETGDYKITAKGEFGGGCVAISNPLEFNTSVPLTNVVHNPPIRRIGF